MDAQVLDFEEALAAAGRSGRRPHVLLGNGFSISCRPEAFNYGALLEEATFDGAHGDIRAVFDLLGTTDFEHVIELLRLAGTLADSYAPKGGIGDRLREDAVLVREALAVTLAARHPDLPYDIEDQEYESARTFLGHFDRIYTLNYDMLLYWTAMQDAGPKISTNDGFTNGDDRDAAYVVWEPYLDYREQRLFYLHGGLHLYDRGNEISKITWSRTGIPLVDQIRDALTEGRYPLIVTEGNSKEKEAKVLHNAYLNHAIRSFAKIGGTLFVHGHSLAENDEHISRRIGEGSLERLFVSLYGDPKSPENKAVAARARGVAARRALRSPAKPLEVAFYDAESAHPCE